MSRDWTYSTNSRYIGPVDVWRRFMAGFTVTRANLIVDDCSKWVVRPMTRYHADRFHRMIQKGPQI